MKTKVISVIVPTHNNGVELVRAIESIVNQEIFGLYSLEIVIVNDAGDLKYRQQLDALLTTYPSCVLYHTDSQSGPAAARNLGISKARGEIIAFLDADDAWPEGKLLLQLPYMEKEDIDVVGGKVKYVIDPLLTHLNMRFEDEEQRVTHVHLGALMVKKRVFEKGLLFDASLRFSEDVDWWFQIREAQLGICLLEETTLNYFIHGENMSVNKSIQDLQMLKVLHKSLKRRMILENNIPLPTIADFRVLREDPLISIIIPLFNGKDLISKALDSILCQTYTHYQIIVVDDGSTDNGSTFIKEHYPQVELLIQQNAGVAAARNAGIKYAKGNIVAFLDQDDEWLPIKLQAQWEWLKSNPYCAFVTCNQLYKYKEGTVFPANFKKNLLVEEHRSFVPSALLIRKHALTAVDMFDESLEVSSDFDLIRKLRKANFKEANIEALLLWKWYHNNNASMDVPIMVKEMLSILHKQIQRK